MPAASSTPKDLVACRRIQVPQEGTQENTTVEIGKKFTPVSAQSAERLQKLGAAAEPNSKEAKAAVRRAKVEAGEDVDDD